MYCPDGRVDMGWAGNLKAETAIRLQLLMCVMLAVCNCNKCHAFKELADINYLYALGVRSYATE